MPKLREQLTFFFMSHTHQKPQPILSTSPVKNYTLKTIMVLTKRINNRTALSLLENNNNTQTLINKNNKKQGSANSNRIESNGTVIFDSKTRNEYSSFRINSILLKLFLSFFFSSSFSFIRFYSNCSFQFVSFRIKRFCSSLISMILAINTILWFLQFKQIFQRHTGAIPSKMKY